MSCARRARVRSFDVDAGVVYSEVCICIQSTRGAATKEDSDNNCRSRGRSQSRERSPTTLSTRKGTLNVADSSPSSNESTPFRKPKSLDDVINAAKSYAATAFVGEAPRPSKKK